MNILVTGATGFLGTRVVEQLCASGATRVRCFVRPNSDTARLDELRSKYPSTRLQYVVGNLLSANDAIRATEGVDTVYHLAAEMRGLPSSVFANTVVASRNVLDGIARHKVRRVVLASSICVYGLATVPTRETVTEETALEAEPEKRDAYTFAKVRQELLFQQYRRDHSFQLVVLRPGVIYGEGGPMLFSRAGLRVGPFLIQIAGRNRLPLTYVSNCAAAVALAGSGEVLPEGSYNVIDDESPSVAEYLRMYRSLVERVRCVRLSFSVAMVLSHILDIYQSHCKAQIPPVLSPYRVRATWEGHTFSSQKLQAVGWRLSVSTAEGISRTLRAASCPKRTTTIDATDLISSQSCLVNSKN